MSSSLKKMLGLKEGGDTSRLKDMLGLAPKMAKGGVVHMQDGGRLPPGIKRATERAKESKSVLPVAGARQARQAIQGYLGMDPSFSVMDPEAQALESAYRGGETASVLGDLFASLTPFAAASAASKANQVPGLAELIAYHGSPHKFKKFDASKIGTGEGAQAYGHGLYFAENPAVAKEYSQRLSRNQYVDARPEIVDAEKKYFDAFNAWTKATINEKPKQEREQLKAIMDEAIKKKDEAYRLFGPQMYSVDLPDEQIAKMLDWDKPLSQQPKAVQEAVNSIVLAEELYKGKYAPRFLDTKTTGGEAIEIFNSVLGSPQVTSNYLREAGIPGIQYLDQASRDAKQGTRNFVVFPGEEQNIKILDINGEPQMAAGGAIHMQDGGDPTQMFNFNPMAAKAAEQERRRREAVEAKRYKSVMGTTPQDLLRRVEPPPAEMTETPQSVMPTTLDRAVVGGLRALGAPAPQARGINQLLSKSVGMLVPDPERIYNQMSEAVKEDDYSKMIGPSIDAAIGYVPLIGPAARLAMPPVKAATTSALDFGRSAGREMLRPIDQAMFGEGPLGNALSMAAPLQAAPRVQAPVSRLGFYDPVEQAGLNIQRKQGPGRAFLNELQRSENVSKDFLEASGIAEKLRTAPNITRDEVQAMTKGAVPEVEELVLGDIKGMALGKEQKIASQLVSSIDSSPRSHINLTGMQGPVFSDEALYYLQDGTVTPDQFPEGLQQLARDYINAHKTAQETKNIPTKWDRDDLILPGGSNYREVLLKVPSTRPSLKNMSREEYNRAIEEADRLGLKDYTHQHWGSTPNVVAHIRMNDRTDYNGNRVLFIEEIQSDWAQEGRKKGFADKPLTRDDLVATVNNSADRPYWEVRTKDGLFIANTGLGDKEINAQEAVDEALQLVKTRGDKRIPTGPFVRNTNEWVDLSLKNIIKRAVDEGYDRVAFINGKQSSDRYNMANYVENIQWDSNPSKFSFGKSDAEKTVVINMQDGNPIRLPITPDGKVQSGRGTPFDGKDLDEIIGKDAAKKIMAGEKGSLEGEGLSIGGKGMKDFYDKIVPDRLRKLIGKDKVKNIPGAVKNAVPDPYIKYYEGDNKFNVYDDRSGELLNYFDTLDEAETYIAKLEKTHPALPQLGFDITPEIREKFSKPIPYKKGGAVRISDNPDTMLLELMNAPKMQAGGAALKAFRDKLLAQYQRSLAKDPRFKQAPGEVTNLAGKSYAQWVAEQQYKHELEDALARLSGVPEKKMSIQDLPVGSRLVSIIGDRTQADKILRSVNETPLANEVILHGGPRFGQGKLAQGKEDFWASQGQAAQGVQNRIDAAAERAKGKPVIGVYTAMSAKDSDMYAKHFAESLIEQYPFTGMTGKQVDAFNKEFRKKYPQFAGVDNPEFVDQIMANTEMRKAFVNEHLKKKNIEKFNIPDGLATRHAITVPELRDVPTGLAGYSVGEMKPGMALEKGSYLEHPTYNTVIPGRYMGGLEIMHDYRDLFPEATQRMRQTLKNNPKFQGPDARDPESQMFGTFGFQGAEQEVTQKLIDELAAREQLIKQLGILPYKKGGKVRMSKNLNTIKYELAMGKKGKRYG